MCKKSFINGLALGLIIALVFLFLNHPVVMVVGLLVLLIISQKRKVHRRGLSNAFFSRFAQRGIILVVITVLLSILIVSPAAALLGMTVPFVGRAMLRNRGPFA